MGNKYNLRNMSREIYTFGHSARSLEEFQKALDIANIDILVDLRKKPQSRYYPHFNKKNLENVFEKKYIFGGDFLGGSPEFHNDLLEYIKNRGENISNSTNKLFYLISDDLKNKIFSKDPKFSNNEKRKYYITKTFLHYYIPEKAEKNAIYFLEKFFEKFKDKNVCFFCSEKEPTHCHRFHLLENRWIKKFSNNVVHIENLLNSSNKKDSQTFLFN